MFNDNKLSITKDVILKKRIGKVRISIMILKLFQVTGEAFL